MELVERDDSLRLLSELATEARDGHGRVVLIGGTVATGKSVLLHTFAERAVNQGMIPVTALASAAEQALPLGVLRQLVDDAPLRTEDRQRAVALLHEGSHAALRTDTLDQVDADLVHGLCTVLLELSERCPLLIAVDDIEYADRASLVCLAYLARRVRSARVVALFTQATHGRHVESRFETDLLRQPNCHRIELDPLSAVGVRVLVAARLGETEAQRHADDWYAFSGGNPLLVDALLRDHRETGDVGDRYGQAVLSCLQRGGEQMTRAAQGFAVLGELHALDSLLGLEPAQTTTAVHALINAGLFTLDGFRHPVARAAVLDALDGDDRARLYGRAARLAYERGDASPVVAAHLLNAGAPNCADPADQPWMLTALQDAARLALRDGQVEQAVAYLRLAWRVCVDACQRMHIATTLVQAEWRINPGAPAGHLPELTEAARNGQLRGSDAVVLAKALLWHGRFDQAREVVTHLKAAGAEADPETATELLIARHWLRTTYPPFHQVLCPPGAAPRPAGTPAAGPVRRPVGVLRSVGDDARRRVDGGEPRRPGEVRPAGHSVSADRRLQAVSALTAVLTGGPRPQIAAAVDRILRSSRLDEMSLDTVESALLALTYGGWTEQAAPWCDLFVTEAASRHAPSRQARLAAVRAEIALRQGDLAGADRYATTAMRTMPVTSWGVTVGAPLSTAILAATAMGRYDDGHAHLDQWVPEAMFETRYGLHYLYARACFGLATGHLTLALDDFERCGGLMQQWGMDVPGLIPWRLDAAGAFLRTGRAGQARRLLEEQSARVGNVPRRVQGMATRLLAATSEPVHRPALLRQAADLLQSDGGDRHELARTLADLARAYRVLGEFRRSGVAERRARTVAAECGAESVLRALGVEGEASPVTPAEDGDGVLSEAERRVAALAAVGCSNREIAENLHVTVSTVEQHLTRTYRKLSITRRADLPALLGTGRSPAARPASPLVAQAAGPGGISR